LGGFQTKNPEEDRYKNLGYFSGRVLFLRVLGLETSIQGTPPGPGGKVSYNQSKAYTCRKVRSRKGSSRIFHGEKFLLENKNLSIRVCSIPYHQTSSIGKQWLPGGGFICTIYCHGDAKVEGKGTATLARRGCRIKQNWLREPIEGGVFWRLGEAYEQVPALICDGYASHSFRAAFWGWDFACREQNPPPNIWGRNLKLLTEKFSSPKKLPPPILDFCLLLYQSVALFY